MQDSFTWINAFSMDWLWEFNWVCPAVKDVVYALKHMISMPTEGITKDGSHLLPMFYKHHVFKPAIIRGQDCANMFDTASGIVMLGLVFDLGLTECMRELKNFCSDTQCVRCTSAQNI